MTTSYSHLNHLNNLPINSDVGTKKNFVYISVSTAPGQPINPQHILPWDYSSSLSAIPVECQLNIGIISLHYHDGQGQHATPDILCYYYVQKGILHTMCISWHA
jgi:hypothetical protein